MEGDTDLSMQYFGSRGVQRVYAIRFDGNELTLERYVPGVAQRLSGDGSTLSGVWQLDQGEGYKDDLAFTFRRTSGADALRRRCPRRRASSITQF
jgi:hypothetical protein